MLVMIKDFMTLAIMFPMIIFLGSYFSYRLRFLQITKLLPAFRVMTFKGKKGALSSFGAMAAILGGNLGTGNISGVAVAIVSGGPGALFWMWVMSILASITKYMGCFLGVMYQRKNSQGLWEGGPMFYLRYGLNSPLLAKLFCIFTITSAFTVGNLVQVHALSLPIQDLEMNPLVFGLLLAFLVGSVIFGGLKRFSRVVSLLVPFMAISYIATCAGILYIFRAEIIPSIFLVFNSALGVGPIFGGAAGFSVLQAIRSGFDRGLFATDSGLGLAPMLHGAVYDNNKEQDNRHVQGLISILSPMIVMVVCSVTGLVLLTTKAVFKTDLFSTKMCMEAFKIGFNADWAGHIVSITLFFFAFTTILTWCFCATRATEFLLGIKFVKLFQMVFVVMIPAGVFMHEKSVWMWADISTNLMFIINVLGVTLLSKAVLKNMPSK